MGFEQPKQKSEVFEAHEAWAEFLGLTLWFPVMPAEILGSLATEVGEALFSFD